jgi:tRNA threonylcarbamoyladenosine biosynthesis protein TsaE
MTWQTVSTSLESTAKLAESLGSRLRGGEVIELVSDLGGGKTTFVRSLTEGMGSVDKVTSPSFTISREYKAGDLTLYHFDFYRLNDPGIVANELAEVVHDPKAVVAVEWADIVEDVLPTDKLTIHIKTTGEFTREFTCTYPEKLQYLIPKDT